MKKISGLAIVLVLIASVAFATQAVRQNYVYNSTGLISAAKASLTAEGVEQLQKILESSEDGRLPASYFQSALERALAPDLKQDNTKGVTRFLKQINNKRLVKCIVSGGSGKFRGRGEYRVTFELEADAAGSESQMANVSQTDRRNIDKYKSASGKSYYLVVTHSKPGETKTWGSHQDMIKLLR
jgi:hypothetical protein